MKRKQEKSILNKVFVGIIFTALVLYSISLMVPMFWALITSLKGYNDYSINMNVLGFPTLDPENYDNSREQFFHLKNYQDFFNVFKFAKGELPFWSRGKQVVHYRDAVGPVGMLFNTLLLVTSGAFLQTIGPAIMAYAVSKFNFKLSRIIYMVALFAMIIPIVGNYPAMLTFLRDTQLYDTIVGYFLMKLNFCGMYFFVFSGFFKALPDSYAEAAEIDGASYYRILFSVILPLSITTLSAVFIIQFVHFWNDFQTVYMFMPSYPTLMYGLWHYAVAKSAGELSRITWRMAGGMTLMIPILIAFIFLKNKLMGNVTMGGLKQ